MKTDTISTQEWGDWSLIYTQPRLTPERMNTRGVVALVSTLIKAVRSDYINACIAALAARETGIAEAAEELKARASGRRYKDPLRQERYEKRLCVNCGAPLPAGFTKVCCQACNDRANLSRREKSREKYKAWMERRTVQGDVGNGGNGGAGK